MRSRNNAAAILMASTLATVVSGCGVDVHSSSIRGVAYVHMEDVVKKHPLYPQLAQLDDAIAAINLAAAAPHVPLSATQIAAQTKELNREMQEAQDRANKILADKQQEYAQKERQAIGAALQAAGVPGAGAFAAQQMSSTSQQQAQQAVAAANADFQAYQQSVVAQSNAASSTIVGQLQAQAQQKLRAKAEQLQQNETDLSLKLTQQDASQRLAIKTRLNNLALDDATRKDLNAQMAAIDNKENAQIEAQRRADSQVMNAYRAQVVAETNAAVKTQVGAIQDETRSKLVERSNEATAQIRSLAPAPLPTNLPPDVQSKIEQIHKGFQAQFQADANGTISDYNATKADLDRQFAALHGADVGATGAAGKELASLQKRRDDLNKDIVDQITREAQRLAKERGFSIAIINPNAAPGGYDLTNDLIKDVESLHE